MASENFQVGVASNWNYPDYGGMLQAFATQEAFERMGWHIEMIDARGVQKTINRRKMGYFLRNGFDLSIVREKGAVLASRLVAKKNHAYGAGLRMRHRAFEQFSSTAFRTSRPNNTWDDLTRTAMNYDLIVVGSDQLWLPSNIAGDYYTLSFVPESVRTASYATSFGVSELPSYQFGKVRSFLSRLGQISVRELSGQKIVHDYTGRDVPVVCDPTLLLDSDAWAQFASDDACPNEQYIFCYLMGDNPYQRRMIEDFAREADLKIVMLPHLDRYIANDYAFGDYQLYDVSPSQFLGLVRRASCVFTDSFHGTIFSCQFERPFFVFPRFTEKATLSTNTRIESLLSTLGLQDHFVEVRDISSCKWGQASISNDLGPRIAEFREHSLDYLRGLSRDC